MDTSKDLVLPAATALSTLERLKPLVEDVKALVDAADADATRTAYATDWRMFEKWCASTGLPSVLPVDPKTVSLYLGALFKKGKKVKTIGRALAGIVHKHREMDEDWVTPDLIRREMRGIRKKRAKAGEKVTKKTAILKDKLVAIVAPIGRTSLPDLRDRALLLLTWDTCSRESEILGLDMSDVTFVEGEGMAIVPRTTKTDQEGEDTAKPVANAIDPNLCAVRAVHAWIQAANITSGPIFRPITKQGVVRATQLSDRSFREIVKKRAKAAGFEPKTFSGHSLRSGWLTNGRREGLDMAKLMIRSKHKSEAMVRGYIQAADLFKNNPSKGLL